MTCNVETAAGIGLAMRFDSLAEANRACACLVAAGYLAESHRIPRIGSDRFGIAIWIRTSPEDLWSREWLVRFECPEFGRTGTDD